MKIPVVSQDSTHRPPVFAHSGDAGADLAASKEVTIAPGCWVLVPTGLSVAIPPGYAGFVLPRSGLAIRTGITVLNAPGLIDAGYRGELKVALINHGPDDFQVGVGDRIAQLVVMAVESPEYELADDLESSSRGTRGFGSTGVRGD